MNKFNNKNTIQSDKGTSYSSLILAISLAICSFLLIETLINVDLKVKERPDYFFNLYFIVVILIMNIVLKKIFPNTVTVKIIENKIEVSNKNCKELIEISNIKRITATTSFLNQCFNSIDYFKVDLKEESKFGKTFFYKTNSKNNSEFTSLLKSSYAKIYS